MSPPPTTDAATTTSPGRTYSAPRLIRLETGATANGLTSGFDVTFSS